MPPKTEGERSLEENEALAGLETRVVTRVLSELRLATRNAHYMKAETFNQLIANLKRDKVLTSVPTIYKDEVISGNHRVQAAIKAGIMEATCIEIVSVLSPSRKMAIQLSHNAINGSDDPSMLQSLYANLDLGDKMYSGLTDDAFGVQELDLASLSAGNTDVVELNLVFLPEHAEEFRRLLDRIGRKAKRANLVGALETFERMFDSLIRVKGELNIYNTAMALDAMVRLANERLDEMIAAGTVPSDAAEAAEAAAEDSATSEAGDAAPGDSE